jgi:hypothetical protein
MTLKNYLHILEQHKVDNKILIKLNDKVAKAKAELAAIGREWTVLQAKVGEANVPKVVIDKYKAAGAKFNSAKKQLKEYIRTGIDPGKYTKYGRHASADFRRGGVEVATVGKTIYIIYGIWAAAVAVYAIYMNTGKRVCNKYFGIQKTRCLLNFEIKALRKKLESLQKDIHKCAKAKNPQRCKREVIAKIKSTQEKIKEQQDKLSLLGKRKKL